MCIRDRAQCNVCGECSILRAKVAEPIKLLFAMVSVVGARNHVLDGCAHWHHLANTVKRLCVVTTTKYDNMASSQIALGSIV